MMLRTLLGKTPESRLEQAHVPDGVRVYAIGDIHGRIDLLDALHQRILDDARTSSPVDSQIVVYLGDYVDRGRNSRDVLDRLIEAPLPGFETVPLRGNHDQFLLDFLDSPQLGDAWLKYGGDATLMSYGIEPPTSMPTLEILTLLRDQLLENMPARHVSFLASCKLAFEVGDYMFVHAGIDPNKPLRYQTAKDLMWIRDTFLKSTVSLSKVIVHGHSVSKAPDVRQNRIGIDTGACYTNRLTGLVLEGSNIRFISSLS